MQMSDHLRAAANLLVELRDKAQSMVEAVDALLGEMNAGNIEPPQSAIELIRAGKCLWCEKKIADGAKKSRGCHWDCYQEAYGQYSELPELERDFMKMGKLVSAGFLARFKKAEKRRIMLAAATKPPTTISADAPDPIDSRVKKKKKGGEG